MYLHYSTYGFENVSIDREIIHSFIKSVSQSVSQLSKAINQSFIKIGMLRACHQDPTILRRNTSHNTRDIHSIYLGMHTGMQTMAETATADYAKYFSTHTCTRRKR